jgi:hypothetical protein
LCFLKSACSFGESSTGSAVFGSGFIYDRPSVRPLYPRYSAQMTFRATKAHVANRGTPPDSFLSELVAWGQYAPESIFAVNDVREDIYALIAPNLGPWIFGVSHRRAAMLEAMRVHAGFESSWNWREGVDTTNKASMENIAGQETGIFQVSFDSLYLGPEQLRPFAIKNDINGASKFIAKMKTNHPLALEYYARLVRVSIAWAGPLKRREILPYLSRDAVAEFQELLK